MRKEANRREYEHERRQERFERLMDMLQKSSSDKDVQVSNSSSGRIETTKDEENSPDSYRD